MGVGKSAIMSHAIYHMMVRKCFTGGVIVLDLKKVKLFNEFRRKLELTIIKKLRLLNSSKRQVVERSDFEEFSHLLADFFNQSDEDFVLNNKRKDKRSKLTFLICLDNCEDLLSSRKEDSIKFQSVILELWKKCKCLSIMISTNSSYKLKNHIRGE